MYSTSSPAQGHSDLMSRTSVPSQGLGFRQYQLPISVDDYEGPSTTWSAQIPRPRYSNQPSPNILSTDFDPFAPVYGTTSISPYSSNVYPTHSLENSIPPLSPSTSYLESQRSSFSSAPPSEPFLHSETYHTFNPRIKVEDHSEWSMGQRNSLIMTPAVQQGRPNSLPSTSSYPGTFEIGMLQPQHQSWPKGESPTGSSVSTSSGTTIMDDLVSNQGEEQLSSSSTVSRLRAPRKMTTREEANFQCKVKGCGKLFSRSYNYKAHLETHDVGRVYPFPCPISGCSKKFVRKTDLQRHHQSVHLKERCHQCDYCSRFFARKDTLRRHMDDGCSKRFDLDVSFGTMYGQAGSSEAKSEPCRTSLQAPYRPSFENHASVTRRHSVTPTPDYLSRTPYPVNEADQGFDSGDRNRRYDFH